MELPFNIDRAIEGVSKVTLRGGLVGKITFSVVIISIAIAAMVWSVSNIWITGMGMLMVFALAVLAIIKLTNFADRNPQAALLEGAEFLLHQQIIHATKAESKLPQSQLAHAQPADVIEAESSAAQLPDGGEPVRLTDNGGQ